MEIPLRSQISIETRREAKSAVGVGHWMQRVLEECERVNAAFGAEAVHDLRVALRRCRSMADGLMVIDPSSSWREMKRAGGRLFRALGALRDAQVMSEWVHQLAPENDSDTKVLLDFLAERESEQKLLAGQALRDFDMKQWRKWSSELPPRAARVRVGSLVFKHLALERWTEAHNLHRLAIRNRSQVAFHRLRIGIKRFRYVVENFLPQQHDAWHSDLKELQDILGEVHDLDVLWATARRVNAFLTLESRTRWHAMVEVKRSQRIARYRERMMGSKSLWSIWRVDLPQGNQIQAAALTRLRLWASFFDPDVSHSRRVAALARQVFDGLARLGLANDHPNARAILVAAAFLHRVGLAKHGKAHQKTSSRMIRKLDPPLGWTPGDLLLLATVVRFHRGIFPHPRHNSFRRLAPEQRRISKLLAGILRFAHAFDDAHDGRVHRLQVEDKNEFLLISAAGFLPLTRMGQDVAAARHLLEIVVRKPILVKPLKEAHR
ncbi:MAG: CHAD domain-containing protein [Acidobacteriaceae bacterium]|nr:CHAD domain-containing protein [Acidobacteriaceae bacterium]MBV9498447.1 CHAD domain-containing protein [Acidobacteriaceae bacterium]